MDDKGVYAVARSVWNNPMFADEEYTQREAWLWLIGAAAWNERKVRGPHGPVTLHRGEFMFSLRFLEERWGWKKSRVERFLKLLENRDAIRDANRDGAKIYSICKYNEFQVVGLKKRDKDQDDDRDATGTASGRDRDKEETLQTLETLNEEKEAAAVPKKPAVRLVAELPDWLDREAWAGFVEMRNSKKKPLTPRAQKNILSKLDEWRMGGHDPTAILDNSTNNSWTDLYEPKAQDAARSDKKRTSTDQHLAGIVSLAREIRGRE